MQEAIRYEQAANHLDVIRKMIQHENDLTNQRLHWMFALQGLLFTATGFVWKDSALLVLIFSIVGCIFCISIGYTLARSLNAIKALLSESREYKKSLPEGMVLPPTIGVRSKAVDWLLPAKLLPWVLGIAWIMILVFRFISNASI